VAGFVLPRQTFREEHHRSSDKHHVDASASLADSNVVGNIAKQDVRTWGLPAWQVLVKPADVYLAALQQSLSNFQAH